jgi:hypothetical protein
LLFCQPVHRILKSHVRRIHARISFFSGFGPIRPTSGIVLDVEALVRDMTPGTFAAAEGAIARSSQALIAGDSSLGACGVLLATVTAGFGSSQQQPRCLDAVLAAAAAAGGAPV